MGGHKSRKEREREQRKREILTVALGLFSQRGFRNVSMQEIADAADYAVGTLYNLFEGKDAMFDELYTNSVSQITNAFLTILEGPGTEKERLSRFILLQPEILEQHAEFMKIYIAEIGQHPGKRSEIDQKEEMRTVINEALYRIIDEGIRKGMFHPADPQITAKAIIALLETLAFEMAEPFSRKEVIGIFQKVENLFLDDLLGLRGKKQ